MYITAFPCNQFDLQEPGNNSEILNGIKHVRPGKGFVPAPHLHIFGKLEVNGKNAHPMYKFLKNACPPTGDALGEMKYYYWDEIRTSDIVWNFEKFIVDRQGRPRYRFHPGAWNAGRFVEQYLAKILNNEDDDVATTPTSTDSNLVMSKADGDDQVQSQFNINSRPHTVPSPSRNVPRPVSERTPIPVPIPEPERGKTHG